jgi:hypothetical protein
MAYQVDGTDGESKASKVCTHTFEASAMISESVKDADGSPRLGALGLPTVLESPIRCGVAVIGQTDVASL